MGETTENTVAPTALSNITKRQQIAKSNRSIFIWVVIAAVVVVTSIVICTFLVRQAIFNQSIISQKSKTNATIVQNIEAAKTLKKNVDNLIADQNLAAVRTPAETSNLQVVFDALPTSGDATTLTNSIYTQILQRSGVTTETITIGDAAMASGAVVSSTLATGSQPATTASAAPLPEPIAIQLTAGGNTGAMASMLSNFEKSIRPMSLNTLAFKFSDKALGTVDVGGETYFLKADSVKLTKKEIKP